MKIKHIHFIINPSSGKEEPILYFINKAFAESKIDWDISVTKKNLGAGEIARKLVGKTNLVAVYGGDGCVTEVAAVLMGTELPLVIIPGGTANVMARELGIPLETEAALALLQKGKFRIKAVDMGLVNGRPFLLRVNLGIMADMVIEANRALKDQIGQLAYGVTAVKTVAAAEAISYHLKIDGQKVETSGVALTVTNSGHMGIKNMALQPGISITDGRLDVILLKDNDLASVFKAAGSALLQKGTDVIEHWACKEVIIRLDRKQAFIRDDEQQTAKKLKIEVLPAAIRILIPTQTK